MEGFNLDKKKKITLVAAIAALSVFLLYVLNEIIFFTSTMKEALFSKNGNYYTWRFGKIFYTKQGQGSPLLLVHDLDPASSEYEWKEVVHYLQKNHTVYTLDLLGCGRSDKPKMTYTSYLYVQLLNDFCKHIIKEPTDIVVTGRSCQSALMACSIDSTIFQNIILVNPEDINNATKYPKYKHKALQLLLNIPIIGTMIYNIAVSRNMLEEQFKYSYFGSRTMIPKKYIDAYHEAAHTQGSASKYLYSSIRCRYTNASVPIAVKKIDNNVIILGGQSVPKIKKIMEQYQALNLSIETATLKGCGYLPQLEYPEQFCENVEIYLK